MSTFPESATTLGLVEQVFWRVPSFTKWVIASSSKVIFAWPSRHSTTRTFTSGTSGPRWFSLTLPHERILRRIWWWTFPTLIDIVTETAIVFLSHISRWFPIANNLQEFFVHAVLFPDSWPRRSSQNFRFWPQNSYFEFLVRYFSSPWFSICDNQVLISFHEFPGHTIPIWSWLSQTLVVFLICTILPRCHHAGFSSSIIIFRPT